MSHYAIRPRRSRPRPAARLAQLVVLALAALPGSGASAASGERVVVDTAAVAGWAAAHPGGGAYLSNRPGAFYMGRLNDGEDFVATDRYRSRRQLHVGAQAYRWGARPGESTCFWLGPRANSTASALYLRESRAGRADTVCGSRHWARAALDDPRTFADAFNCPPGSADGPQWTRTVKDAGFHYNVAWAADEEARRYRAGALLPNRGGPIPLPARTDLAFRYAADGVANVFHPVHGWGFVAAGTLAPAIGLWGHEGEAWQVPCGKRPARFSLSNDDRGTIHHEFVAGDSDSIPVAGDWNGDGPDGVGYFDGTRFHLYDALVAAPAAVVTSLGITGLPVTGDWDGDGRDGVGVVAGGRAYLSDRPAPLLSPVTSVVELGSRDGTPLAADFDGDGIDTVVLFADGVFRSGVSAAPVDATAAAVAAAAATPLSGDWDGDGRDGTGVAADGSIATRDGRAELPRPAISIDPLDRINRYVAGDWDGDGTDTVAVFREYP